MLAFVVPALCAVRRHMTVLKRRGIWSAGETGAEVRPIWGKCHSTEK